MKQKRHDKIKRVSLLLLMTALLLSACSGMQQETPALLGGTLPSVGIPEAAVQEVRPETGSTQAVPEASAGMSTEDASEVTGSAPESTETARTEAAPETAAPTATAAPPETSAPATTAAPPETTVPVTTAVPPETTAPATTAAPSETSAPTTTAAPPEIVPTADAAGGVRVWMGDSRFVGIRDNAAYDKEKDVFICKWGMGYDWMLETAFPEFEKLAASGTKIDICYWSLGANDITNEPSDRNMELAAMFAAEVSKLIAAHPETTFYLLSYGPVGEEGMDPNNIPDCAAYNKALRLFTDRVRGLTGMRYLDQGEYLERTGFSVYDGCHYDAATNKRAYAYVLAQSGQ